MGFRLPGGACACHTLVERFHSSKKDKTSGEVAHGKLLLSSMRGMYMATATTLTEYTTNPA